MFLTKGQLEVIENIASKAGWDRELSELKTSQSFSPISSTLYNANNIKGGGSISDVFRIVNATAKVIRSGLLTTNGTEEVVPLRQISEAEISNLIESTFNKPIFEWVYYFINAGNLYFLHDSYVASLGIISLNYIKIPTEITGAYNPEINSKYHKDIIDAAVAIALATVNDVRVRGTKQ